MSLHLTRDKDHLEPSPAASPATMQELSELLGISRVTISKALNGRPGVAPETRQRILEAVKATNFQPNALAQNLRRQRTQRLGVIITGANGWTFTNWYYGEYLRGILERAEEVGYNIVLFTHKNASQLGEDFSRVVRAREADALLLVGSNANVEQIQPLLRRKIPFAVLGALPEGISTNGVYYDNMAGAKLAVEHLISLGHRRIGVMGSVTTENKRFFNPRLQGAVAALKDAGLAPLGHDSYLVTVDEVKDQVEKVGPCAVVSLIYTATYFRKLLDVGLRIPADVAMVGFDSPSSVFAHPHLTVVDQPLSEIGRRAVEKVVQLLREEKAVMPTELLPMRIVPRGSCGAPVHTGSVDDR